MASVAERLASNVNFGVLAKAETLKKRLWFTLGALIVYRIGSYIPIPGIDPAALEDVFSQNAGGILGMFDMFAGGALGRMTIFALNIIPYISASIIMQLLAATTPRLNQLKKEGEAGRKIINQYTRYGTVFLSALQGYGVAIGLESLQSSVGSVVIEPGALFRYSTVITLVGGTIFLMWLGEQITQRGIGNGISLIIFAGIVANLPQALVSTLDLGRSGALSTGLLFFFLVMAIVVIAFIVFMERAQRRLIVQYPKRQVGNKIVGQQSNHMPLKLNSAGVIPPIFASSLLLLPSTVGQLNASGGPEWLYEFSTLLGGPGQPVYTSIYMALIIFFAFFYTALVFNPQETAENLRKNGGYIPGIRPGAHTADHIDYILTRLTTVGSIYLAAVCLLPEYLIAEYALPFYFGGTSLLIVVSVSMDTMSQVQSHLIVHQYEALIKNARIRGARRR
ncbi:MAG: preprotein translocase subunit SecY [Alphaproteobacteria bacterium GM7ARS4]|nr:preprotein translocase subunit SecY [Alphaproteobacteria bacterium GM7ARS4]